MPSGRSLGDAAIAASKIIRNRKFHWCRLRNDFVDMPLWRAIAQESALPLVAVQAFVVRLDTLGNKSIPRSYVGDFDASEFAVALDIPPEHAARIYASLELHGWIEQERLTTFWERNPDKDDPTAAERKERERGFKSALRELSRQSRAGLIDDGERTRREIAIFALRDQGRSGLIEWPEQKKTLEGLLALSTCHASHIVTGVTVTPRAEQRFKLGAVENRFVENFEDSGRGETAREIDKVSAQDPQSSAQVWLMTAGVRIVVERVRATANGAHATIERWRADLDGDCAVLVEIMRAADRVNCHGEQFRAIVADGIRRFRQDQFGRELPFGPTPIRKVNHGS